MDKFKRSLKPPDFDDEFVQRISHRYVGRIWAESQAGKGSTFYITLESRL